MQDRTIGCICQLTEDGTPVLKDYAECPVHRPEVTPRGKALELIEKYSTYAVMWTGELETQNNNVKQCALIAAEEVRKSHHMYTGNLNPTWLFWDTVIKELRKI
jgi:hypothetical protein